MEWHNDFDWIFNVATLAMIGVVSLMKAVVLFAFNKGRRRDRLVYGLIVWNAFVAVLFLWGTGRAVDLLPDNSLLRSVLRAGGIVAGLIVLFALRTAPPLWESVAMQDLRRRVEELEGELDARAQDPTPPR
jgi:hypothetical protein